MQVAGVVCWYLVKSVQRHQKEKHLSMGSWTASVGSYPTKHEHLHASGLHVCECQAGTCRYPTPGIEGSPQAGRQVVGAGLTCTLSVESRVKLVELFARDVS